MRSGADRFAFQPCERRIVEQPHDRVALGDGVVEPVLIQPQVYRDPRQDGRPGLVELAVQFAEHRLEFSRARRPDVGRHRHIGQRAAGGQIAPDVPELLEVVQHGVLGDLHPERRITARPANRRIVIAALFLFGQGKELLGQLPRAVDQRGVDPKVFDQRKPKCLEAAADGLRKFSRIIGQRKNG